ncbi:MAG: 4-hydroxythreonine-4-phosphate dehydrogenase PdxA [Candidatus Schekmanbacteria bacterium]|nr:4-hydroxythreonine-4-phosphate dehydrogenase PdxA [Candidatus Schekmanbacteria bacterium]
MRQIPIIGITMGDPTGIGPEIIVKALSCTEITSNFYPLVIGAPRLIEQLARKSYFSHVEVIWEVPETPPPPGTIRVFDPYEADLSRLLPGKPSVISGEASLAYIHKAVELAQVGQIDAITTAPISKEAIKAAGSPYPGHTEFLADLTKSPTHAMLLVGGSLRVVLATIHIPLAEVPIHLKTQGILDVIHLVDANLNRLGAKEKRIAVAALNPHAGESGIFGNEEQTRITPAIEQAQKEGIAVSGPYPADSLFWRAAQGEFDAVVAMYHDQGLIPLKLLAFHTGVNVTLGLPIIRTSPDHGCAFNLAGKNQANPSSMIEAIKLALRMALYKESSKQNDH